MAEAATKGIGIEQRKRLSTTFLTFAWIIEAAAASVGLILAISRLQDDVGFQGILASLPFFAVAVMEMTKIPLATVIYHTASKRWRYGFTAILALTMVITFETFVIGFDTYQAQLEKRIKPTIDAVSDLKLKIISIEENQTASESMVRSTADIDTDYKNITATINDKFDKIIGGYEKQKLGIDKKYEGSGAAVNIQIANLDSQLKEKKTQRNEEKQALKSELENLSQQATSRGETGRDNIKNIIKGLNAELRQLRQDKIQREEQIRKKAGSDYRACQIADAASFLGKPCDEIRKQERSDLKELDANHRKEVSSKQAKILAQQNALSAAPVTIASPEEATIRESYGSRIKKIDTDIDSLQNKKAEKIAELGRIQGKRTPSDIAAKKELDKKINAANGQRNNELKEAKKEADARRGRSNKAKKGVAGYVGDANKLRSKLAPKCAELNEVVSSNQVYRLAMQFYGVDEACDLKQEQLTMTQWVWYGSLALVVSALGTALAFAGLVIKYPPSFPSGGGIGGMIRGLLRRSSYALVLLHRRLRRPKIKKVTVEKEVIKEVTKEVIKEVPVDKVVYRDVPREVVKRELVHVPLFTQNIKDIVKDD